MEDWKNIYGHDGYQISDTGKVRSYINNRHGIGNREPHMLKLSRNKHGYDTVCLGRNNRRLVHRLVAEAFVPNPNNLPIVRHLDDNPKNNHVDNLAWGTQTDNMRDCVKHGRLVGDTSAAIESKKMKVVAINIKTGLRQYFDSINDAARKLDLWPQHISSTVRGKISQTGGYRFEVCSND